MRLIRRWLTTKAGRVCSRTRVTWWAPVADVEHVTFWLPGGLCGLLLTHPSPATTQLTPAYIRSVKLQITEYFVPLRLSHILHFKESDYNMINNCDYNTGQNYRIVILSRDGAAQAVFPSSSEPTPLLPQRSESWIKYVCYFCPFAASCAAVIKRPRASQHLQIILLNLLRPVWSI